MNKGEFESRIDGTVTDEEYAEIQDVYVWHSAIPEVGGKDKIAEIYKIGGMGLIHSMAESAKICKDYILQLEEKMRNIAEMQKQINIAQSECAKIREKLDFYKF